MTSPIEPAPEGPGSSGPGSGAATPSPGRAFLVYTALRLALLLVSYAVLVALGLEGLLAVGAAVLLSAGLSLVLLKNQRDAFTSASMARADARRAEREARQARLDEADPSQG